MRNGPWCVQNHTDPVGRQQLMRKVYCFMERAWGCNDASFRRTKILKNRLSTRPSWPTGLAGVLPLHLPSRYEELILAYTARHFLREVNGLSGRRIPKDDTPGCNGVATDSSSSPPVRKPSTAASSSQLYRTYNSRWPKSIKPSRWWGVQKQSGATHLTRRYLQIGRVT